MAHPIKLVCMRSFHHDYAPMFAAAFARLGVAADIVEFPLFELKATRPAILRALIAHLAPDAPGQCVLYCPGVMELYFAHADHSFHFSSYRTWHDPARMTVLPYPWSVHSGHDRDRLRWTGKPPLSVGFMGSVYGDAVLVRLFRRLPAFVRRQLLRGRYLRHPLTAARLYAAGVPLRFALAFPRVETLAAARAIGPDATVDIVDTGGFTGQQDAKDRYTDALAATTYALCPRGSENFSFRAFEALLFGRVPVIVDTDMVFPDSIRWDDVAIVVPYDRVAELPAIIRADYDAHDAAGFARRQERAFAAMAALADGHWLDAAIVAALGQPHPVVRKS